MAFDPDAYLAKKQPREEAAPATTGGFDPDAYLKKLGIEAPAPEPGFFGRLFGSKPAVPAPSATIMSPEETVAPPIAEPVVAPVKEEPKPYKNKLEALDDAVNLLEEGYGMDRVVKAFGNIGLSKDEIVAHGQKRKSEYFAPSKIQDIGVGAPAGAPVPPPAEMRGMDTTLYEDITGIGKRSAARGRQAIAGLLKEAGVYDPDELARITAIEERKIQAAPPSISVQQGIENISQSKTMSEAAYNLAANPAATFTMLAESLLMTAPVLATAMVGAPAVAFGTAVGTFSGSLEYGSALSEALADKKIDPMNAYEIGKALQDPKFVADLRERGLKRGLTIGVIDGLTAGLAGKFIAPVQRQIAAGNLSGTQARNATIGAWAKETGMQVAGGGGGEALAQALTGEYKPADILLEAVAEGIGAPIEARRAIIESRKIEGAAPPPIAPVPPAPPVPAAPAAKIEPTLGAAPAAAPTVDTQTQQDLINKAQQDFNGKIVTTTNYQTADDIEINLGKDARDIYVNELKRLQDDVFEKRGIKPPAAVAEEAAPPITGEAPQFVNEETNMGSRITQLQSGPAAGGFAVTTLDLDSGMPLSEVRIFKTPQEAEAFAKDVIQLPAAPKVAEIPFRNANQQRVVEAVMKNFDMTPEQVSGYINEGRIKLGKDGKMTAKSVEELRVVGQIERDSALLKESLAPKAAPAVTPGLPITAEEEQYKAQRAAEVTQLGKEIKAKSVLTPENNLYHFFFHSARKRKENKPDNRLNFQDALDVSKDDPSINSNLFRKKGGTSISSFVSSGQLDEWLPPNLRPFSTDDATTSFNKEKDATEYIKEALRNQDFLPYETKLEIEQLGMTLDSIEQEIQQEADLDILRDILTEIAETEGVTDIESIIAGFPQERPAKPAAAPAEPFTLAQETEQERALREAEEAQTRETREAQAIADRERELFTLTPETPEITTPPTGDMFGARGLTEQPARAAPVAPVTETGLFATTEPVNADPATERVDRNTGVQQPPILETPADYKARKGRQDQVVFAARLLAEGLITKEQYDDYVNYYMPVAEVPLNKIEAPLSPDELRAVLKLPKVNKDDAKIDAPVADGTSVGLRMDIPALVEAAKRGMKGSVVSIHQGTDPSKSTVGRNISYKSAGALRNARMAIRNEKTALKVAESLPGTEGQKAPQQTIEGNWVNMTPDQVMAAVKANFNNPEWVQVGFDPLRHSFFYSRRDMRPIVSADEVLQIGRFVLAKNPVYAPRQQFFYDITQASQGSQYNIEKLPSFGREFDRLNKAYLNGFISGDEVVSKLDELRQTLLDARDFKFRGDRKRGADFIRQKLLEAKRRGDIEAEAVDMAEWFISQNPSLVDDLGISIRKPPESETGVAGSYNQLSRIIRLIKGSFKTDAPVHEILHHLERMMPEPIRRPIQQSWLRSFIRSQKEANESTDDALKLYYKLLSDYHFGGVGERNLREAADLIQRGSVAPEHYQNFNPSEFWAVNASRIVQGRFDARDSTLARLKQWLTELVQKIKTIFKAKSDASIIRALDSLAKSDGKFVSSVMLGEGGIYNSVVRKNIFGGPAPNPTWGSPDEYKKDDVIAILQDKMIDTKRVIGEIKKVVGQIEDRWNAYLQEELYHGRTAKQTNNFLNDELTPLLKDMQKSGVTIAELEEFLHNNTAEERNIQVAKINPNMPDGGSGILTADAQAYLANLSPEKRQTLQSLANQVYKIISNTQDILVKSGLETPQTIQAWKKAYKNYVPLMREEADYETVNIGRGVGQGFSVKGSASKRAMGSSRNVIDILANIAMQREKAIVRAEKTRVSQAIYGLAIQYPNTDFWLAIDPKAITSPKQAVNDLIAMGLNPADAANIIKEPTSKVIDPVTNQVTERINPILRTAENVLAVRVNGADKFVFFNTQDPRALRMVQALKNLDADQLSRALSLTGRITRYYASINTQYNPIFGIRNFTRDVEGAMFNLSTTPIADKYKQVLKDTMPALRGIYSDLRSRRKGRGAKSGTWAQLWEEFQIEGGQTGFRDQFSRSEERAEALAKALTQLSQGKLKTSVRAIFDWLSDYNETLENAVRLAAYKAAKDKGLSNAKAASIAKNLTVNFNRKGQIGRQMGALYMFFNASIQGTARTYKTLRGPLGKKIIYGGLLLGSAQAMLLAAAGFDEDQPSDFVKEKNLVIPLFIEGKYINIPMPLGFNVIPNTGRVLTEWGMSGFKNTSKRVAQLFNSYLEAFNPIGNAGFSMQTIAPTPLDPIAAIIENKDWTGKPIAKKDISSLDPTPGYTRAKDTASWFSKQMSYFLNLATGGTKYQPGVISPTPDQLDYLIGQVTGGVGREVMKVEQSIASAITGEELPSYKIPLVGGFYGNVQEAAGVREKFYDNIKMLNQHENEIKGRQKNREDVQEYLLENPEARLFRQANIIERNIQKLRKYKEEMKKRDAPKEEIKRIEDQMTSRMKRLNDMVRDARP